MSEAKLMYRVNYKYRDNGANYSGVTYAEQEPISIKEVLALVQSENEGYIWTGKITAYGTYPVYV